MYYSGARHGIGIVVLTVGVILIGTSYINCLHNIVAHLCFFAYSILFACFYRITVHVISHLRPLLNFEAKVLKSTRYTLPCCLRKYFFCTHQLVTVFVFSNIFLLAYIHTHIFSIVVNQYMLNSTHMNIYRCLCLQIFLFFTCTNTHTRMYICMYIYAIFSVDGVCV